MQATSTFSRNEGRISVGNNDRRLGFRRRFEKVNFALIALEPLFCERPIAVVSGHGDKCPVRTHNDCLPLYREWEFVSASSLFLSSVVLFEFKVALFASAKLNGCLPTTATPAWKANQIMMSELVFWHAMLDVFVAVICGGAIGLDRQLRGKPAGLRTCIIVVLTTALFVTLGKNATEVGGDPSRVVTGIVTGVGFLGAGVIFSQGGQVQGIATASLIWALAAIGVTLGFGYPITAITTTALIMGVLMVIDLAERRFPRLRKTLNAEKES